MNKQITVFTGCVARGGKVLLVQRNEKECPCAHLKWEMPGGKTEFDETPEESVAREVFEETGVKVKVKKLLPLIITSYWDYAWGRQQTLVLFYRCEFLSEKSVKLDHHVKKVRWVPLEKVKQLKVLPGTLEALAIFKLGGQIKHQLPYSAPLHGILYRNSHKQH